MSFIDAKLLDKVSYGFTSVATVDKTIIRMRNGSTRRILRSTRPLHRFAAPYELIDSSNRMLVIDAFNAAGVSAFRFRDWSNYQVIDQQIATGTGASQQVQLFQRASFGGVVMDRPITKPSAEPVLTVAGSAIASTTDLLTGIVTFTAASGQAVLATFDFDVPVFFDSTDIEWAFANWDSHTGEIALMEDVNA